jgi:putative PLP-dependent aminotransferase (TIGR04422 family)
MLLEQWPPISTKATALTCKASKERIEKFLQKHYSTYCLLMPSGRAALFGIASAFGIERNDIIKIPLWSSHCLYNALGIWGTPTVNANDGKLLILNHKWGILHNIDETHLNKFEYIVEDSVDSIITSNKGLYLNGGCYEIVSLSKILGMPGGAIVFCKNKSFYDVLKSAVKKNEDIELSKSLWKYKIEYYRNSKSETLFKLFDSAEPYNLVLSEELIGLINLSDKFLSSLFDKFIKRYLIICSKLDKLNRRLLELIINSNDSRYPTVIPIPVNLIDIKKFNDEGIDLSVRNFNLNRNCFNVSYQPCYTFPLHIGVDNNLFEKLLLLLENALL